MSIGNKVTDRYEIRQTLGQGGMGVVYWAYDVLIRRDVALKTIRDAPDPAALDLFYKECNILASISHPNIIEIFDIGKFEDEGAEKPYFVMPLLKGVTLDNLISGASRRLTIERTVEILSQTCRGLQAAHERGLVHRDLKPSNIFVLEDDSVKIIDFGVARMADTQTSSGPKGTLLYMSPEQVQLKPATALSDIFSLGVVAYEALTARRPFDGPTHRDIANAILRHIPPPASDLNPAVNALLSRVVHKTMAKQPWNRFSTAKELADAFQKAMRNETIEAFDSTRIQPRMDRAIKAFESGDHQFASEILTELESEGHLLPEMAPLRRKIDQAIRQKMLSQLLESARARMEHEEYPLALQKVHEALEIDAGNDEALRLQREIESSRSTRQVEAWLRLARQHLDRFAFSHARQAIENVLQMRPSDPQALQLMTEIERGEQQYTELRQEKEQLYQSAVKAYEKLELSAALSKLERVLELEKKAPEISSPERAASYQSLYNQVRSEQDANMTAYAEARRALAEGNFQRAMEISEEALTKYPGQALFQALKFDIEEQKRRQLSAYIAEVNRQIEAEPDLDKRVEIVRAAAEQYPEEHHFERTLRLMRDKRELVNSIVAKARRLEEQAQFSEALMQWEILRSVYGEYPGLEFEMERVSRRRDQLVRNEAKARWTQKIDRQIEQRDYARAAESLAEAQAEFPGDPELEELARLVRQGQEKSAQIQSLLARARELSTAGKFDEAVAELRQAHSLDERDKPVRSALVDTLVQQARSIPENDWKRASEIVASALALDPSNSQARSLSTLLADRERDETIDQCVSRARQLQAAGDLPGALALIEPILVSYPSATRLQQLQATLQRALADSQRDQSGPGELEKLKRLEEQSIAATGADQQREIVTAIRELAAHHLDDPEYQNVLIRVEKRYATLSRAASFVTTAGNAPPPPSPPPPAAPAHDTMSTPTEIFAAPLNLAHVLNTASTPTQLYTPPPAREPEIGVDTGNAPTEIFSLQPKAPVPPMTREPAPPPVTPPPPPPLPAPVAMTPSPLRRPVNWKMWVGIGGGALIVLAAGFMALLFDQYRKPARDARPIPGAVQVAVKTVPDGAAISVNDKPYGTSNLELKLPPGTYQISAVREGYRPQQTSITVSAGHPASADLVLQPLPATLRLLTDFTAASVTLDGQPQTGIQSGQVTLDNLAPGGHVLTIASGGSNNTFRFDARAGEPPAVTGLETSKDASAILIANVGSRARLYSSQKTATVSVDGKQVGALGPNGIDLNGIGPGDHEINLADGQDHRRVIYVTPPAPTITIYLNNNAGQLTTGTLVVITGEDGVRVTINGQPVRIATRRGELRLPNVQPGQYTIAVNKDGFQPVPPQHVTINKGEEAKVAFHLQPVPAIAMLHVEGAMPGTQVYVDDKLAATAAADGIIPAIPVSPGSHHVQLRRDEYRPKNFQLSFAAGANSSLAGSDVALEPAFGTLVVNVNPAGAQVTVQRAGEAARPVTGSTVRLAEGTYTVSASAPHYLAQSATVEITTGTTKNISIQLVGETVVTPPKRQPAHVGMSGWTSPWEPDGDHFIRRGGNLVLFKPQGLGTYSFTASMVHGKQLRWVLHATDPKNYVEFELDSEHFYRRQVVNGKSKELVKRKHGLRLENGIAAAFQVSVNPGGITQRIQTAGGWAVLDSWPDPSLKDGSFGFLIRGRDEVSLSGFSFTGAE